MVKINKIILVSLISAFGFALFNSSASVNNTSTALAASNSKTLHTKIIPASIRKTLKKSDGSYYEANKLYIRFDDTKRGYHGTISDIKKITINKTNSGVAYIITDSNKKSYGFFDTKSEFTFIYPVNNKSTNLDFNK